MTDMLSATGITAAVFIAGYAVIRARHWRRSYRQALGLYRNLPQPITPQQRGAATKRANRSAWVRQHCADILASVGKEPKP